MMDQLLKQIAPNLSTDLVHICRDNPLWYKIIDGRLMVPPVPILQRNIRELDKFVESVKSFAATGGASSLYNWNKDSLELSTITVCSELRKLHDTLRHHTICAVDIETRRIEWEDNKMLSIGFAYDDNKVVAIDWPVLDQEGLQILQEILSDPEITFIWHNGKFDCTRLKYLAGIDARVDEDTQLLHYACVNERRGTHKLKDLGPLYLQAPQWDDELQRIKKQYCTAHGMLLDDFTYDLLPTDVLLPYMMFDCIATLRLWHLFLQLQNDGTAWIYRKLCEASNVYRDVELAGFKLDMESLEDLEYELQKEYDKALEVFNAAVQREWNPSEYVRATGAKSFPKKFNMNSPKQLKWLLEKMVGHKLQSTEADVIDSLKGDNPEHSALLDALKTVRKLNKQIDTYIIGFRERICTDYRIRGNFNLFGTETGRLSSSDPNMQNIPRKGPIKRLFIAETGKTLLQLDYSQAELRVLAYVAEDPVMTQLYVEGKDLHGEMAQLVFGDDWTDEHRSLCKSIVFGSIYGRGVSSVAESFNVSMGEARNIMNKVFSFLSKARDWIANQRVMAKTGDDCISVFGRRRHFVMTSQDALNHIQNEYVNTPIQSAASDLTMFSLMEIHSWITKWDLQERVRIISTVHDSIILELDDDPQLLDICATACCTIMAEKPMEMLPGCKVPFKADAEYGPVWGELTKWKSS